MPPPPKKITAGDIFCEFFEVAVHSILFIRKVYPDAIFAKKKKYGVVVYQSIFPPLNEYIINTVKAIKFHTDTKQLKQVDVCIFAEGNIKEKFVFDVMNLEETFENNFMLVRLEQNLRALILKLHSAENYLNALPEDTRFTVQLHINEAAAVEFNKQPQFEDFPWVEISKHEVVRHSADIVPLHTVETEAFKFQVYIEKPYFE